MSNRAKVTRFLDDLSVANKEHYELIQALREIIVGLCPEVSQRIIYGGIMFSLDEDFGGVFPYKNHVSFEFVQGYQFDDPGQLLEGKGKYRRHIKLTGIADIEKKCVQSYVKQAIERISQ